MKETQQGVTAHLTELNDRKAQHLARRHGATGVLTHPATPAEASHARQIAASAADMRAKGYRVDVAKTAQETVYAIQVKGGPHATEFTHEDADEILSECPAYVALADYVLARHEQDAE